MPLDLISTYGLVACVICLIGIIIHDIWFADKFEDIDYDGS